MARFASTSATCFVCGSIAASASTSCIAASTRSGVAAHEAAGDPSDVVRVAALEIERPRHDVSGGEQAAARREADVGVRGALRREHGPIPGCPRAPGTVDEKSEASGHEQSALRFACQHHQGRAPPGTATADAPLLTIDYKFRKPGNMPESSAAAAARGRRASADDPSGPSGHDLVRAARPDNRC